MEAKYINPFIDAFITVMPQMGFQNITKSNVSVKEKAAESLGVTVLVGLTKQVRGNVAYNMPEDTAKFIASTMMCGMPVETFDEMAQSAIAEMSNMLTASAATNLANLGLETDISTPTVTVGQGFSVKISNEQYLCISMHIEDRQLDINIALS